MEQEFYQKQYDFEIDQKNNLTSSANTPIVALTVVGGGLSTLVTGFKYSNEGLTFAFVALVGLTVVALLCSLYFVVRSFLGYEYQKIASARYLVEFLGNLETWYLDNGEDAHSARLKAKSDINDFLNEKLSEASEHNSENNIRRGEYLHYATTAIAIAFVLLFLSTPFYFYQKLYKIDEVHKIEIVKPIPSINKELIMVEKLGAGGDSDSQEAKPAEAKTETTQATTAKPVGPPNTVFRSNMEKLADQETGPEKPSSSKDKD